MDERSERIAKRFEIPMLIAAALVIPTIIIEEAGPGEPLETLGVALNYAVWTAFLVEAVVMLWVVPNRWEWVRHHPMEVIIVVLTPPFFLSAFQGIRLVRLLRLLRLLRLAPLVRRLFTAQGVRFTAATALLTALAGGAAFHQTETGKSFGDGLYWALTTMTTVGYGDLYPKTPEGKIVAVIVMLVGIGFIAMITGAIAQAFIRPRAVRHDGALTDETGTEDELLAQCRALSSRMRELERALEARLGSQR